MLRFRSPNRPCPRDYLSRREQWRLLLLVMSLGLVLILMRQLHRAETAAWLGRLLNGGQSAEQPAAHFVTPTFPAPLPSPATAPVVPDGPASDAPRYFPGVDPTLLAAIRDNTYFRQEEQDAWFNLLAILQKTPQAELRAASIGEVGYTQLVDQPHVYRGRLVTVRGTVHQITLQHPAKNQIGLEAYYRLVIRPADGGLWPFFVYVLELPVGMEPGKDPSADVAITGFYFKSLSYEWQDGLGIAPVVLAKGVTDHHPFPTGEGRSEGDSDSASPHPIPLPEGEGTDGAQAGELTKVLSLAGWGRERLAAFGDDTPLTDDQRQSLAELVWRLRSFSPASLAAWTRKDISFDSLLAEPAEHRGELIGLAGRVRRVTRHELSADAAERLEMPAYFECELALEGDESATVITGRVPKVWLEMDGLDEPVSASGVFVKRLPADGSNGRLLFVSGRIAWHPTVTREPLVSFGESVLGTLGMDVGLLDDVRNHQPILATEREAFYEMLAAAGRAGASQLVRFAQDSLGTVRQQWQREAEQPGSEPGRPRPRPNDGQQRRLLAEEVVRRADEGRFSVAPLFNDPDGQIGQLAVFEGAARRAARVEVGTSPDGSPSDVLRRFGIDHYYELDVFTDDSQDFPLVFCVSELPAGFPTGGAIHEPVRVAGFFFKSWLYQTRKPLDGSHDDTLAGQPQYAPLLIGRAPIWLQPPSAGGPWPALVVAGLVVLAMGCVWGVTWWWAKGNRRFDRTVLSRDRTLPEGQSLNDLDVPDAPADARD
jgi:hypothetical protein